MSALDVSNASQELITLYNTFSLCPKCSFVDRKGLTSEHWKKAFVVEDRSGFVFQIVTCPDHGDQRVTICSDSTFFKKMMRFTPGIMDTTRETVLDIEELYSRFHYKKNQFYNHPLVIDVEIFRTGGTEFLEDSVLLGNIIRASKSVPRNKNYILRLNGKLTREIELLNTKIRRVLQHQRSTGENPILLELSYDRIMELSRLQDTVLLDSLVYPSIHVYIQHGNEEQDAQELERAYGILKGISNMQVVIRLVISRPLPRLDRILRDIRQNMKGFTRFVIIEVERTPKQIMTHFKSNGGQEESMMDPLDVLRLIETCTAGQIKISDFYPVSVGLVMEPFLNFMGMGKYNIRPSPWCGFATCLVNTSEGGLDSVPLSRLFDIDRLYSEMLPIVQQLQSKEDKVSLSVLRAIKKAVNGSMRPEMAHYIPTDLLGYAIDSDKRQLMNDTLRDLQFIIVHNLMDVASLDMVRRSRCSLCSSDGSDELVASCTKCL
jgi:hypothetical protein